MMPILVSIVLLFHFSVCMILIDSLFEIKPLEVVSLALTRIHQILTKLFISDLLLMQPFICWQNNRL